MICKDCKYFREYTDAVYNGNWPVRVWNRCTEPTNCLEEDFVTGHKRVDSISCYERNAKGQCKNGEPREENE